MLPGITITLIVVLAVRLDLSIDLSSFTRSAVLHPSRLSCTAAVRMAVYLTCFRAILVCVAFPDHVFDVGGDDRRPHLWGKCSSAWWYDLDSGKSTAH